MEEEKKKRGRPKGSKNKAETKPNKDKKPKKKGRPKGAKNKVVKQEKKENKEIVVPEEKEKKPKNKLELIESMEFDLETRKKDRIKYMIYCEMIDEIEDVAIVGSYKYKRLDEMKREIKAYVKYCICMHEYPTINVLNRLFGHGKNVLKSIENKNIAVSELMEIVEIISEDMIRNMPGVFSIFLLKSKHGYRENITINNHSTNTKRVINYNLKKKGEK